MVKYNTFALISLGCKVNSYECGALKSELISHGLKYDEQNPDVIIINTCSVTSVADKKSRQHIRSLRNKFPVSKIIVMGCYSQKNHKFIYEELKADIVTGCSNRKDVIKFLLQDKNGDITDEDAREFNYEEISQTSFFDNVRAYLKIQDGCDNFCSYCLIPYLRGKMRSRNKEDILKEAKYLVKNGYKEIVLAGIHVGGYGRDLNNYSFSDLIEELSNIEGLKRITISSIEASEIDDKLIDLLKTKNNIAKHLHIPLQSGSETVLKRMNRKYNKQEFLNVINKLRKDNDDLFIATDVIVGFPGETEDEFIETINFIKEVNFNKLHVFPFSAREGTKAYEMDNQIDPNTKKERVKTLLKLSEELYKTFLQKNKNKKINVLIEAYDKNKKMYYGHSENFLEVYIESKKDIINELIETVFK